MKFKSIAIIDLLNAGVKASLHETNHRTVFYYMNIEDLKPPSAEFSHGIFGFIFGLAVFNKNDFCIFWNSQIT